MAASSGCADLLLDMLRGERLSLFATYQDLYAADPIGDGQVLPMLDREQALLRDEIALGREKARLLRVLQTLQEERHALIVERTPLLRTARPL